MFHQTQTWVFWAFFAQISIYVRSLGVIVLNYIFILFILMREMQKPLVFICWNKKLLMKLDRTVALS